MLRAWHRSRSAGRSKRTSSSRTWQHWVSNIIRIDRIEREIEGNRGKYDCIWLYTGRFYITYITFIRIWTKISGASDWFGSPRVPGSKELLLYWASQPIHWVTKRLTRASNMWRYVKCQTRRFSQTNAGGMKIVPKCHISRCISALRWMYPLCPFTILTPWKSWFGIGSVHFGIGQICASQPVPSVGAAVGCWCGKQIAPRPRWPQASWGNDRPWCRICRPWVTHNHTKHSDDFGWQWRHKNCRVSPETEPPMITTLCFSSAGHSLRLQHDRRKASPNLQQTCGCQGLPYSLSKLAGVQTKHWSCNLKAVKDECNIVQLCAPVK